MQDMTQCFHPFVQLLLRICSKMVGSVMSMVLRPYPENVRMILRFEIASYFVAVRQINWSLLPRLSVAVKVIKHGVTVGTDWSCRNWRSVQYKVTTAPLLHISTHTTSYSKVWLITEDNNVRIACVYSQCWNFWLLWASKTFGQWLKYFSGTLSTSTSIHEPMPMPQRNNFSELNTFSRLRNKKDGYRQQNVRQRQKLISIIDYDVCILEYLQPF